MKKTGTAKTHKKNTVKKESVLNKGKQNRIQKKQKKKGSNEEKQSRHEHGTSDTKLEKET